MRSITVAIFASALMLGEIVAGTAAEQSSLQVPQSIRHQHEQIISRLSHFAGHVAYGAVAGVVVGLSPLI